MVLLCRRKDSISDGVNIRGADKVTGFRLGKEVETKSKFGAPPIFDLPMLIP